MNKKQKAARPLARTEFQRVLEALRKSGFDIGFHADYGDFVVDLLEHLEAYGLTIRPALKG